MIKVQ